MGELAASAFTTIFIVAGLFGITAGLVLIFLIFVMLAAERKSEMGMARAVGAQRGHLVEMFVFEGTAYDLAAAAVGVALGVATGLIIAVTLGQAFAGVGPHHSPERQRRQPGGVLLARHAGDLRHRALLRQPRQPSEHRLRHPRSAGAAAPAAATCATACWRRSGSLRMASGRSFRLRIFRALRAWLIGLPGSLLRLVWLGFTSGPFTLLLGLFLTPIGIQNTNAAAYSLGVSFVIIGGGLMLRGLLRPLFRRLGRGRAWNTGRSSRTASPITLMGLTLTVFWSLPNQLPAG